MPKAARALCKKIPHEAEFSENAWCRSARRAGTLSNENVRFVSMFPVFISVRVCTSALVDSPLPTAAVGRHRPIAKTVDGLRPESPTGGANAGENGKVVTCGAGLSMRRCHMPVRQKKPLRGPCQRNGFPGAR